MVSKYLIKDQNTKSKELGANLEDNGNSYRSEKERKGRLGDRKEKQDLQLFRFPGKPKDEIGHFNITSIKTIILKVTKFPWENALSKMIDKAVDHPYI